MNGVALNLNLATRPLRNRRLYTAAVRVLAVLLVVLTGLSAFIILKDGRAMAKLKATMTEAQKLQTEAQRDLRRLRADIDRVEKSSRPAVDLMNGIISRKMFSWTGFLSDLEQSLPGPSYITSLVPAFNQEGALALQMRLTSRSLPDLTAFITALYAHGFTNVDVGGETRDEGGRLISEISATYERPL